MKQCTDGGTRHTADCYHFSVGNRTDSVVYQKCDIFSSSTEPIR